MVLIFKMQQSVHTAETEGLPPGQVYNIRLLQNTAPKRNIGPEITQTMYYQQLCTTKPPLKQHEQHTRSLFRSKSPRHRIALA